MRPQEAGDGLGQVNRSIEQPTKKDPKYYTWIFENMLIMNWTLTQQRSIAAGFCYWDGKGTLGFYFGSLCSEKEQCKNT